MKKLFFLIAVLLSITAAFAQDLKKVQGELTNKQLDKAKTDIDAFVAKNPNDPSGLYLQSKIYIAISSSDQFKTLVPGDARAIAFDAFKKAMDNSKNNKEFTLMMIQDKDFLKPIIDIYTGYYEAGANYFNNATPTNNKEGFAKSLDMFKQADAVGRYIYLNKWSNFSDIDTILVLTLGKAALNAGNNQETLNYFKKLADAKIFWTKDDKLSYVLPYQWLTYHYKEAKDEPNMLKYAALGKQYFPKEDYFDAVLLDYYREKKDFDALFKEYDVITAAFPDSLQYHFNYANEAFSYIYNADAGTKIPNRDVILKDVGIQLDKSLAITPNSVSANWLMGQYYYNAAVDIKDQAGAIKGTKPEDVKRRTDLTNQAKDLFNKAIPFAEKALSVVENNGYKKADKSKYKSISDLLARIYSGLGQADNVKIYQAKYDGADAKFVN